MTNFVLAPTVQFLNITNVACLVMLQNGPKKKQKKKPNILQIKQRQKCRRVCICKYTKLQSPRSPWLHILKVILCVIVLSTRNSNIKLGV